VRKMGNWLKKQFNKLKEWFREKVPGFGKPLKVFSGEVEGAEWKIEIYTWGSIIILNHKAACIVIWSLMLASIPTAENPAWHNFPANIIIAANLHIHAWAIKVKNDNSDGKGIKIYTSWLTGTVWDIVRRGKGWSPCEIMGTDFWGDAAGPIFTQWLESDLYEWIATWNLRLP
jgi:hypothetical protein